MEGWPFLIDRGISQHSQPMLNGDEIGVPVSAVGAERSCPRDCERHMVAKFGGLARFLAL